MITEICGRETLWLYTIILYRVFTKPGLWTGPWAHSYSGSDQSLFIKKSRKCFWDITVTDRWVVTRPVTDRCNVIIRGKTSVVVCLWIYIVNRQGHISQEKIRELVKNHKNSSSNILPYMVYTAITLLAIYSYSYYTASYSYSKSYSCSWPAKING